MSVYLRLVSVYFEILQPVRCRPLLFDFWRIVIRFSKIYAINLSEALAWEQCKFSDVATTRRGLTYKPTDLCEQGVRVLRSSNIEGEYFLLRQDDVFVKAAAINIEYAKENDILITAANGSTKLVGKHALITKIALKSAVHGGFMLLATAKVPYFLNALMSSSWYTSFIGQYVAGGNGAIGNLKKQDLDNQNIVIPTVSEQRKIGSFFHTIDSLITLHQREHL